MTEPEADPVRAPRSAPDPRFAQLEAMILGDSPSLTNEAVAEGAGVTVDEARRLWRALGFPDAGDAAAFTEADLVALDHLQGAVEAGAIDGDTAVRLTRALGQTMSRLADWQVATLAARVEELESGDQASGSRMDTALRLAGQVTDPFEHLLVYSWRRHLAAAVARVEALGANDADLHTTRVTVGFADLVRFTALSNQLSEDQIGDLVEIFESRCMDVVAGQRGRVIKTLGDSVLFVCERAEGALNIALGIIEVIGRDARLPDVRLGLATGSVVLQLGDVYGPPVNMAARLTGVARRNRVIADAATAAALPPGRFDCRTLPPRPVRGFGLVEPVAIRRH